MKLPNVSTILKWAGVAGLLLMSLSSALGEHPDLNQAGAYFSAAMVSAGLTKKLTALSDNQESLAADAKAIKADTTNIRNDPAMPGTPL